MIRRASRTRRGDDAAGPILGNLDVPSERRITTPHRAVRLAGWAAGPDGQAAEVSVRVGGEAVLVAKRTDRPDASRAIESRTGSPAGANLGFEHDLVINGQAGEPVQVVASAGTEARVLAELSIELGDAPVRADYATNWEPLGSDPAAARMMVAGTTDEERIAETGAITVARLDATTGLHPADVVLEIGCGVGRVGAALEGRCARWIGTDVSAGMLERTRERLGERDDFEVVEISGWDLAPIADESVDLVYSTVVFMHIDEFDRYAYVLEAMRVLRPGGRILIDSYNLLGEAGWQLFEAQRTGWHPLARPPMISRPSTEAELATYLTRAGFEAVQSEAESLWCWAWGTKPA